MTQYVEQSALVNTPQGCWLASEQKNMSTCPWTSHWTPVSSKGPPVHKNLHRGTEASIINIVQMTPYFSATVNQVHQNQISFILTDLFPVCTLLCLRRRKEQKVFTMCFKLYFRLKQRCHLLSLAWLTSYHATLPQVSFPDQTPYFIGRNLQSMSYTVEMMKWSWSTMKVTFGRCTVFIFITAEFLYYFPLIKHETRPSLTFFGLWQVF